MGAVEVATVGDNCIDRYLALRRSTVGGNAVNVAVHLSRMGRGVAYFGAVGHDREGARVLAGLRDNGVDVGHVQLRDGQTAWTDIAVDAAGERIIAAEEFGVCAGYRPATREIDALRGLRHVHIGWLDDGGALKHALAAAGASLSQDLSVNAAAGDRRAEGLTVAFASAGPSIDAGMRLVDEVLSGGAGTAVVTCGPLGSLASDGAMTARTGVLQVAAVDTLGAGDTFIAGFTAARLAGRGLQDCLDAGRDAAALTCLHLGGFPQVPAGLP